MDTLQAIFPAHDASFLASTLALHGGRLERAVDALLGGDGAADAALAQSLLRDQATQWEADTRRRIPDAVRASPARLEAHLRGEPPRDGPPSLAARAAGSVRGLVARLAAPRAAAPIFRTHLTEPMLSPLDADRSHC